MNSSPWTGWTNTIGGGLEPIGPTAPGDAGDFGEMGVQRVRVDEGHDEALSGQMAPKYVEMGALVSPRNCSPCCG